MLKTLKNIFIANAILQSSANEAEPTAPIPRMLTADEIQEFNRLSNQIVLKNKESILDGFEFFRPYESVRRSYQSVKEIEKEDGDIPTFSMK